MTEKERLVDWLVAPSSEMETRSGQAIIEQLMMLGPSDARGVLRVLRDACISASKRGQLVNARVVTFVTWPLGAMAAQFLDERAQGLDPSLARSRPSADDILQALASRPLHHLESESLSEALEQLIHRIRDFGKGQAAPAIWAHLRAVVDELQREFAEQRAEVIFREWGIIFEALRTEIQFSRDLALISYLLLTVLFDARDLSAFEMHP